jgi:hypothetical protein
MIKKENSKPSCYFKVVTPDSKRKKIRLFKISIFSQLKVQNFFFERGQGLKINIRLIDQIK